MAVRFVGGGNRSTRRNLPNRGKSLTNVITRVGFELRTLVVLDVTNKTNIWHALIFPKYETLHFMCFNALQGLVVKYLAFSSFAYETYTRWRLFQKSVVYTTLDIYVFSNLVNYFDLLQKCLLTGYIDHNFEKRYNLTCAPISVSSIKFNIIYSYKYLESDLIKHCHVIFIHSLSQPLIVRSNSKIHRSRGNPKEIPTWASRVSNYSYFPPFNRQHTWRPATGSSL